MWKQKLELILAFNELNLHIGDSAGRPPGSDQADTSFKQDAKAKAIIGLTLSHGHLEHVRDCATAASMWSTIMDLFQRKTLLNKLHCRRRFYSAKMADSEKIMAFISRVRQLASDCKAMGVSIDDQEIAMTVICGLPQKYEHLIVAIDAATDDESLSLDFVKSRLLQEEQRLLERKDVKPAVDAALVHNVHKQAVGNCVVCGHCGKSNHTEARCWQKYPHLKPNKPNIRNAGLAARAPKFDNVSDSDSDGYMCLMCKAPDPSIGLATRATWIIDSGATAHI